MARVMARQPLLRIYGVLVFLLIVAASVTFLVSLPSNQRRRAKPTAAEQHAFSSTRRFLRQQQLQLQDLQQLQQLTPTTTVAVAYPRSGGPVVVRHSIAIQSEAVHLAANVSVPETRDNRPLKSARPIQGVNVDTMKVPAGPAVSNHSIQPPARDAVQSNKAATTAAEVKRDPVPLYSSVNSLPRYPQTTAKDRAGKGGNPGSEYYHILHNVRVEFVGPSELGLVVFHPVGQPVPQNPLRKYTFHSEGDTQLSVAVHYRSVEADEVGNVWCKDNWLTKPAILFHTPYANNIFHMFNDGILATFQTLRDMKMLPRHIVRLLSSAPNEQQAHEEGCTIDSSSQEVALISMTPRVFQQPWSFMLDHISTDQSSLAEMRGVCFETLILGTNQVTDMYRRDRGEAFIEQRELALRDFQRFAFMSALTRKLEGLHSSAPNAELLQLSCQVQNSLQTSKIGATLASPKTWLSGTSVPRVTLATRALPASRALLNEAQIMAYITARWDVDVVTTTFNGTLYDSMDLMQHTDVFLGMHGAGWTNALFLSKDAVALQLLPYGWEIKEGPDKGWNLREDLYKGMVVGLNATYFSWMNQDPANAFLRRVDFEYEKEPWKYVVHPDASLSADMPRDQMPKEWWIYQNTIANLKAFIPTVEVTFSAAGISEKDSWISKSASTLLVLEAETEAIRRKYLPVVPEKRLAIKQQPSPIVILKLERPENEQPGSTDSEVFPLVLASASKVADQVSSGGKGKEGAGKILNEPQEADDGDDDDIDVVARQDGNKRSEDILAGNQISNAYQKLRDWTGEVL